MELVIKRFDELNTDELYEILRVRAQIFVVEQDCAYQDIDSLDKSAYHIFLLNGAEIKAYLRIVHGMDEIKIGRVLTTERGKGYAGIILNEAIKTVKEKLHGEKIVIDAQTYAKGMYEKFGFKQTSEEFLEEGIPHVKMVALI